MHYLTEWNAISSRIKGLAETARLHAAFLAVRNSDSYDVGGHLASQGRDVLIAIESFGARHRKVLSASVTSAIDQFIGTRRALFNEAADGPDIKDERMRATAVLLPAFETQMSHLLSDVQPAILARSELAFAHLQRLIAADLDIQKKWQNAFAVGETACEKLGASHLLGHGIWAFKASSPKAITDLVFQDVPVVDAPTFAAGLVLTEWKIADTAHIPDAFDLAITQAKLYAPGSTIGQRIDRHALRYCGHGRRYRRATE